MIKQYYNKTNKYNNIFKVILTTLHLNLVIILNLVHKKKIQ